MAPHDQPRSPSKDSAVSAALATAPAPRDEYLGMTFDQWVEQNAERVWTLLCASDRRDVTFNDLAEQLWSQL